MAEIYAFNNETDTASLFRLLKLLGDSEYPKTGRAESLCGRILVRYLALKKYGLSQNDLKFNQNAYGKPFLEGCRFCFSISHSGSWTVCGVSHTELGVDIEKLRDAELKIAKRFFSPQEQALLYSCPPSKKAGLFFELWTLKESYIKFMGKGLAIPLNSFSINKSPAGWRLQGQSDIIFKQLDFDSGYKLAVCTTTKKINDQVSVVNVSDVEELFQPR